MQAAVSSARPVTAFVLGGGGSLSAMQAGMVHALYERNIAPDLLIGTSAGALNAAFLASRPPTTATAQELAEIWRQLRDVAAQHCSSSAWSRHPSHCT